MSWQATHWVTKHSQHKGSNLLCLLMIANYADASGRNAFPSVDKLAADCRMSPRQITRILQSLEESGELQIQAGHGRGHHHTFQLPLVETEDGAPQTVSKSLDTKSPKTARQKVTSCQGKGDILSSSPPPKGDILSTEKVTFSAEKVTNPAIKGDICASPPIRARKNPPSEYKNSHKEREPEARAREDDHDEQTSFPLPSAVQSPPTLPDVEAALHDLGEDVAEAKLFHDYYEARDWRLDGNPVRDWRKLLALWLTRRNQFPARAAPATSATPKLLPLAPGESALASAARREKERLEAILAKGKSHVS